MLTGLTFGVDAYYKLVRNMQDEEQLGASLIFTPFTFRYGYKEGLEITANHQRSDWLLYGNVAVAETKGRESIRRRHRQARRWPRCRSVAFKSNH